MRHGDDSDGSPLRFVIPNEPASRPFGAPIRSIVLVAKDIKAEYKDGLLSLTIPKTLVKAVTVAVKAAS